MLEIKTRVLPVRTLEIMKSSGRPVETERQRQVLFGHLYGPAGREFFRGLRDGSLSMAGLPRFSEAIKTHFFDTIGEEYAAPQDVKKTELNTDLQGIGIEAVKRIVDEAFPRLGKRLAEFKNEVLLKSPDPTKLFKILVMSEEEVDGRLAFEVIRQLVVSDTAGPLYFISRHAELNQKLSDLNDAFNEELFERPYGAGHEYELPVCHDNETNRVLRFFPSGNAKPPRGRERLATHKFTARRVKGYGLVYTDISEVGVVDATIQALIAATKNDGKAIQPLKDGGIGIKMTFVDLEDRPKGVRRSNIPHLTALRAKVMGVLLRHLNIARTRAIDDPIGENGGSKSRGIEIYTEGLPQVPFYIEFKNRLDHLNGQYEVGNKVLTPPFPEPVYNGRSERLVRLRSLYPLMPYLFPPEFFGDTQSALLLTIEREAEQLKQECSSRTTYLGPQDIKAIIG